MRGAPAKNRETLGEGPNAVVYRWAGLKGIVLCDGPNVVLRRAKVMTEPSTGTNAIGVVLSAHFWSDYNICESECSTRLLPIHAFDAFVCLQPPLLSPLIPRQPSAVISAIVAHPLTPVLS